MRVLKIVSSDYPDYPMYVEVDADSIQRGLERMAEGIEETDDGCKVEIVITPAEMPQEEFEALEPWGP